MMSKIKQWFKALMGFDLNHELNAVFTIVPILYLIQQIMYYDFIWFRQRVGLLEHAVEIGDKELVELAMTIARSANIAHLIGVAVITLMIYGSIHLRHLVFHAHHKVTDKPNGEIQ
jgi:hypothetical protein